MLWSASTTVPLSRPAAGIQGPFDQHRARLQRRADSLPDDKLSGVGGGSLSQVRGGIKRVACPSVVLPGESTSLLALLRVRARSSPATHPEGRRRPGREAVAGSPHAAAICVAFAIPGQPWCGCLERRSARPARPDSSAHLFVPWRVTR
jgi:hypothetical protein